MGRRNPLVPARRVPVFRPGDHIEAEWPAWGRLAAGPKRVDDDTH